MTKEEAIEVYNGLINTKIKEAFEFFVPELRESEDERIRKWIYAYMMACPNDTFEFYAGVGKGRVLEWLEKQKEQKLLPGFDVGREVGQVEAEQKPVEWSEEDEIELNDAIKYVQNYGETSSDEYTRLRTKEIVEWFKSIRPPFKDKEMKLKILKYLSTRCSSLEYEEVEEYLNNLRPSWKPSEGQMKVFFKATPVNLMPEELLVYQSLYEDLQKLM